MKWFAKFCLILLCFTVLSCSGTSSIFLHNDTSDSFDYRINAKGERNEDGPMEGSGVLAAGDVKDVLGYYSNSITRVDIEITQNGSTRKHTFQIKDLPNSLQSASSGGNWSHVNVSREEFSIGEGSGIWFQDFQHSFGLMWIPCVWLTLILGLIPLIILLKKRRARLSVKT